MPINFKSLLGRSTSHQKLKCFLSYSHGDGRIYANALAKQLKSSGHSTLFDEVFLSEGANLSNAIGEALQQADALIIIWTPKASRSQWVHAEIELFSRRRYIIIPITFGNTRFEELPIRLRNLNWLIDDESSLHTGPSRMAMGEILGALQSFSKSLPENQRQETPKRTNKEKEILNEGKLILIGRGEVGKTSIVKQLLGKSFRSDESKTHGINITKWLLKCSDSTLRLNIWDFGGQEIMHSTHQFFLTERSLYLLVLNGREGGEDSDAEYWLKHIESFGGDSPVIIVQNKIEEHYFDLNYRGLQARHPRIQGFFKTDCRNAKGIDELRGKISEVAGGMPEVRMQFPLDWFRVKERLESIDEDFMGYDRFLRFCHDEGITDDSAIDALGWILHCLGIVLNYRDDPRLLETSILKAEWVTGGIYALLNASDLAANQGEMHLDDLLKILPKERYPIEKHAFLMELMRKFSLCFAFYDDPNRYLVPELLGKEEPEEMASFPPKSCLNFEYHYGLLPEGLMARFIVRSHTLSRGQKRWRSGVILAHEDAKALVYTDAENRRVIVRVKAGDSNSRRQLLGIVRYDLDRLNGEFRNRLDANPKVPLIDHPELLIDYGKLLAFEKQGIAEFPEIMGQQVISINVKELLNGVDFEAQRATLPDALQKAKSVFFSYSHKDEFLRDELETHLKLLQRQGFISIWHDRKIFPGEEWKQEIDRNIETAHIIFLLVSANFIASDYCWEKEVKLALDRHKKGDAIVIPILLKECDWQGAPFGRLQGLPKDMKPVSAWKNRDSAWTQIAKCIRIIIETGKFP